MSVLYHHRGGLDELLKLDRWWRSVKCSTPLYIRLDEDDECMQEVYEHFSSGAFLPFWDLYFGPRLDDAIDLSDEMYFTFGVDAAVSLLLVTDDPLKIALYLLAFDDDEVDGIDEH